MKSVKSMIKSYKKSGQLNKEFKTATPKRKKEIVEELRMEIHKFRASAIDVQAKLDKIIALTTVMEKILVTNRIHRSNNI